MSPQFAILFWVFVLIMLQYILLKGKYVQWAQADNPRGHSLGASFFVDPYMGIVAWKLSRFAQVIIY